jgi:hypothetical protein
MRRVILLVTCLAVMTSARKRLSDSEELLMRLEAMKRDEKCTGPAGKCFNTAHCCNGLICASFDEKSVEHPEVPGNCVKSKDLQTCGPSGGEVDQCPEGSECLPLGRGCQRYCVNHQPQNQEEAAPLGADGASRSGLGGLGSVCETSRDCAPHGEDRSVKLCCQQVRRGRQGIRQLCDRVTLISACI